jgi:hypothetical protein
MRFFNVNSTTMSVTGNASRRDVVAMLVLDRSGSMCNGSSTPCASTSSTPCGSMVKAAKLFTGQFAENRDYIGLVSFSDNAYVHSAPTQTFQTTLGYQNNFGSANGAIDSISCIGGTSTAQAVSMAYQLLYQTNLPGALNMVLLETDGFPNMLTMNFWDSTNNVAGLKSTSNCQDANSHTEGGSPVGFTSSATVPNWTAGLNLNAAPFLTSHPFFSNIPAGMIGGVYGTDPGGGNSFNVMMNYWTTTTQSQSTGTAGDPFNSTTYLGNSTAPGCAFDSTHGTANPADIAWFPPTDVYGNSLNPSYGYQSVTTDAQGHITQNGWTNYHNAALNGTENSAYRIRTNGTLPAYFFDIGLGGNGATLDWVLFQRMANDPNADTFNSPAQYPACSTEVACATFSAQPQGMFVYAPNTTMLGQAFLRISSQVLRLSK